MNLEKIRERFGQAAVDEALRTAAQAIQSGLRPTDFVGRWNSTEFMAILNDCTESEVHPRGRTSSEIGPPFGN